MRTSTSILIFLLVSFAIALSFVIGIATGLSSSYDFMCEAIKKKYPNDTEFCQDK